MTSYTPPSPAEDAFEDYLDRLNEGETVDVALFLEEHPTPVRQELERMIDDWHDMRGRFGGEDRPLNGTLSGGYRVLEPLGRGGMGTVYAAEEEATGRQVALKVLSQEHEYSDQAWKRFEREALLAAAIAHPRCVFVYGVARVEGRPAIAMERMPGRTLQDELDDGRRYSVEEACELALAVLDGLAAAYRAGVIHRDVKPSNCFLDGEGGVKVGDFGISRALENPGDLTLAGQFLGSAHYASPEQVQGGEVDPTTDVYSLGATLYALLAGKPPYEGETLGEVLANVIAKPPADVRDVRSDVPDKLAAVLDKAMARKPGARYRDLEEMRLALKPFTASEKSLGARRGRVGTFDAPWLRKLFRTVEFFVEHWRKQDDLEEPERILDTDFRNGRGRILKVERYIVLGEVGRSARGRYLLGFDPVLDRNVWLHVCEGELAVELPEDRDAARLRHIETVRSEGRRIDVYEDPGGTRLTAYAIRRVPLPWPLVRRNLELFTQVLEGEYPPQRLGQLWVDRNGDLRVLDVAMHRNEDPELEPAELLAQTAAQFLLKRGTGELRSGPVSSRVETLQRRITGIGRPYGSHGEARRALRSVANVPAYLTRTQRMLPSAMVFLFSASVLLLHTPRMMRDADGPDSFYAYLIGPESPILYGYMAFAALCVLFAFVSRGSLWCTVSNLEVRMIDGRKAARWRCGLRSLVAWVVALMASSWPFLAAEELANKSWLFEGFYQGAYNLMWSLGMAPLAFLPLGTPALAFVDKLPFLPRTCVVHG